MEPLKTAAAALTIVLVKEHINSLDIDIQLACFRKNIKPVNTIHLLSS